MGIVNYNALLYELNKFHNCPVQLEVEFSMEKKLIYTAAH